MKFVKIAYANILLEFQDHLLFKLTDILMMNLQKNQPSSIQGKMSVCYYKLIIFRKSLLMTISKFYMTYSCVERSVKFFDKMDFLKSTLRAVFSIDICTTTQVLEFLK